MSDNLLNTQSNSVAETSEELGSPLIKNKDDSQNENFVRAETTNAIGKGNQGVSEDESENQPLIEETTIGLGAGSVESSVFSLVILCLGSGTLTFPYIFYANGLVLGVSLILFGAFISVYTGWLILQCA